MMLPDSEPSVSFFTRKGSSKRASPMTASTSPCITITQVETMTILCPCTRSIGQPRKPSPSRGPGDIDAVFLRKSIMCLSAVTIPTEIGVDDGDDLDWDDGEFSYDKDPDQVRGTDEWQPAILFSMSWGVESFDTPPMHVVKIPGSQPRLMSTVTIPHEIMDEMDLYEEDDKLDERVEETLDKLSPNRGSIMQRSLTRILRLPLRLSCVVPQSQNA